ncbi:MAG: endonuclease III [Candidatus Aminicenantes bacterium]
MTDPSGDAVEKAVPSKEERIKETIDILQTKYPRSRTALNYENPLQILVATILSAQSTDKKVNEITPVLFKKYPTAERLAEASPEEVEDIIRPTGFFRNKTKSILGSACRIRDRYEGEVPSTMEELLTLPGVARKTANIVLSSAFHKASGIAVDTHVMRLSRRLGFTRGKNPDKIEKDLMVLVPRKNWLHFNFMLVNFGRDICQARRPRCGACPLSHLCPSRLPDEHK